MEEKEYKIPVTYLMYGVMKVKASSLEKAKRKAIEKEPLPTDAQYISGSCEIDEDSIESLNK